METRERERQSARASLRKMVDLFESERQRGRVREVKKPSFVSGKTGVDYLRKGKSQFFFFTISCGTVT